MIKKKITAKEALARAESLCAKGEWCRSEISEKLFRWGISPSDSEKIIDSLVDRKFIDELRYATAYVKSQYLFVRWGRMKISRALAVKRIPRDIVEEALGVIEEDAYISAAKVLVYKKAEGMERPLSRENSIKIARSMMSRGFEWEYVKNAINSIGSELEEDF